MSSSQTEALPPRLQIWLALRCHLRVAPQLTLDADLRPRSAASLKRNRFGPCYETLLGALAMTTVAESEIDSHTIGQIRGRLLQAAVENSAPSSPGKKRASPQQRIRLPVEVAQLIQWAMAHDSKQNPAIVSEAAISEAQSIAGAIGALREFELALEADLYIVTPFGAEWDGVCPTPPLWQRNTPHSVIEAERAIAQFLHSTQYDLFAAHDALLAGDPPRFRGAVRRWRVQFANSEYEQENDVTVDIPPIDSGAPSSPSLLASNALGNTRVESLARQDRLGRERLTQALATLLKHRETTEPLSIGLFGPWGSGKSSQIALLRKACDAMVGPAVRFAEFNAWSHEKADKPAAALAQAVVDELIRPLGYWQELWLAVQLAVHRHRRLARWWQELRELLPGPVLFLGSVLLVGIALYHVSESIYRFGETNGWWISLASLTTAGVAAALAIRKFVADNLTDWFKQLNLADQLGKLRLPDFSVHLGLHHEIRQNLEQLCALALAGGDKADQGEYLLLVVDDLDRCNPNTVKEVFDAVRLVAHIPRVVVLVAIDERMAFAAVSRYFAEYGHAGREPAQAARDYLAKVFQLSVTLPAISGDHVQAYVDASLFSDLADPEPPAAPSPAADATQPAEAAPPADVIPPSPVETGADQAETPSPGRNDTPAPAVTATPPKPLTGTLRDERTCFAALALACDFSNPRLLWRLMQTWRLLKNLVLHDGYAMAELAPWLVLLFWREWLQQQDGEARRRADRWTPAEATGQPAKLAALREASGQAVQWDARSYALHCAVVDQLLLPGAPSATAGPAAQDLPARGGNAYLRGMNRTRHTSAWWRRL